MEGELLRRDDRLALDSEGGQRVHVLGSGDGEEELRSVADHRERVTEKHRVGVLCRGRHQVDNVGATPE